MHTVADATFLWQCRCFKLCISVPVYDNSFFFGKKASEIFVSDVQQDINYLHVIFIIVLLHFHVMFTSFLTCMIRKLQKRSFWNQKNWENDEDDPELQVKVLFLLISNLELVHKSTSELCDLIFTLDPDAERSFEI